MDVYEISCNNLHQIYTLFGQLMMFYSIDFNQYISVIATRSTSQNGPTNMAPKDAMPTVFQFCAQNPMYNVHTSITKNLNEQIRVPWKYPWYPELTLGYPESPLSQHWIYPGE
jgi:hypothetical protein